MRILVVDDHKDTADSLAMWVKLLGHETTVAYDGFAAILKAGQFTPQLILLDITMPGMDGYNTCKEIRRRTGGRVDIVAVTGLSGSEDRSRSAEAGFDDHLVKPVDRAALESALHRAKQLHT